MVGTDKSSCGGMRERERLSPKQGSAGPVTDQAVPGKCWRLSPTSKENVMTQEREDRREYVRLPLDGDMMVRYGHRGQCYFGSCQDLSPGGLFIATRTPAPSGAEVLLKFKLPGHERTLQARGKVVRVHKARKRSAGVSPGMHIRFTKIGTRTEEEIKRFLVPRLRQMVIRQLAQRRRPK